MEESVRLFGFICVVLISLYVLSTRPRNILQVFVFCAPFAYFGQTIGIVFTPAKMILILFFGYIMLSNKVFIYRKGSHLAYFFPYFIYIVFLTLIMTYFWPEYQQGTSGFFYSSGRGAVQLFQQVLGFMAVIMVVWVIRDFSDLIAAYRTLIFALTIMVIAGFYVFLAQLLGLPYFGIARAQGINAGHEDLISTVVGGLSIPRAYSFSGEPKGLASDIILLCTMTLFLPRTLQTSIVRKIGIPIFILFLVVVLVATLSTAGFLIFPLAALIGVLVTLYLGNGTTKILSGIFWISGSLGALLLMGFGDWISTVLDERLIGRLQESGLGTFAENAILEYWMIEPLSMLFGNGLGGSHFYIRVIDPDSYAGLVAAPRGIIGWIADKGLIGVFLYLGAIFVCILSIVRQLRQSKSDRAHAMLLSGTIIFTLVGLLLVFTKAGWFLEWLLLGLLVATADMCAQDKLKRSENAS